MSEQNEKPRGAHLYYDILDALDISIAEYFYLDMIYYLSRNEKGWCYKSLNSIAKDMHITSIGVMKLRNRLIDKKLIEKKHNGNVRTSEIYNKVIRDGSTAYNKVYKPYNKVISSVKQSYNKNNNRITLDNDVKGLESPNKEKIRQALKQHNWSLFKDA